MCGTVMFLPPRSNAALPNPHSGDSCLCILKMQLDTGEQVSKKCGQFIHHLDPVSHPRRLVVYKEVFPLGQW